MSVAQDREAEEVKTDASATLFNQAQREYLKGHWEETEILLNRRLAKQPRDVEARLLLATMFRRSLRLEESLEQLDVMQRFDESARWLFEINRERELIELDRQYLLTSHAEQGDHVAIDHAAEPPRSKAG